MVDVEEYKKAFFGWCDEIDDFAVRKHQLAGKGMFLFYYFYHFYSLPLLSPL
jgi:hypothetical protein